MAYLNEVIKKYGIQIRSVTEDDAEFTLKIRQDKRLTKYIPYLNQTLDEQKKWIRMQRDKKGDYFFIVEYLDSVPFATFGLEFYDDKGEDVEGVRLISYEQSFYNIKILKIAYYLAFEYFNVKRYYAHYIDGNERLKKLFKMLGGTFDRKAEDKSWSGERYVLTRDDYMINKNILDAF